MRLHFKSDEDFYNEFGFSSLQAISGSCENGKIPRFTWNKNFYYFLWSRTSHKKEVQWRDKFDVCRGCA